MHVQELIFMKRKSAGLSQDFTTENSRIQTAVKIPIFHLHHVDQVKIRHLPEENCTDKATSCPLNIDLAKPDSN